MLIQQWDNIVCLSALLYPSIYPANTIGLHSLNADLTLDQRATVAQR